MRQFREESGVRRAPTMFVVLPHKQRCPVDEKALFTKFWTHEAKTTSKVISRIPENNTYKPDPKSRTAMDIAWQIVSEEKMLIEAFETGKMDWKPSPTPKTMKEVHAAYDKQSAAIVETFNKMSEAKWNADMEFFG